MTDAARRRAERCFAVARSTSFPGERETAIAQGTKIAEAAGLDLDLFDIPGRAKEANPSKASMRYRETLFEGGGVLREFHYAMNDPAIGPDDPRFADLLQAVLDEVGRRDRRKR